MKKTNEILHDYINKSLQENYRHGETQFFKVYISDMTDKEVFENFKRGVYAYMDGKKTYLFNEGGNMNIDSEYAMEFLSTFDKLIENDFKEKSTEVLKEFYGY